MRYPNTIQYKNAVLEPESFASLKDITPVMNSHEPVLASGNFAVVFKMEQKGKKHALKCFTKDIEGRAERQKQIVDFINKNPSRHFVDYHYLENELWIDEGEGYEVPVTWMEWVDAPTLGEKIKEYCETKNHEGLQKLIENFREFALWLLEQPFAHGDLKHDNLLVKEDGTFVMIDYDGMYIPAFKGMNATELGSPDYQHPRRSADFFNGDLDDFSILIIYLSLLALYQYPDLLEKYNNGQNIIFDRKIFISPKKSELISLLIERGFKSTYLIELEKICYLRNSNITNIVSLIDYRISLLDFQAELVRIEDKITKQLNDIVKYKWLYKDRPSIISHIERWKEDGIRKMFLSLNQSIVNTDTHKAPLIKREWWDGLSTEWKKLVLYNVKRVQDENERIIGTPSLANESLLIGFEKFEPIIDDLSFLRYYDEICKLKTFFWFNIEDLAPISGLKQLTSVRLYKPNEINAISQLKRLVFLRIDEADVDFRKINTLPNLNRLELYSCWGNSLTSFKELESIQEIYFQYNAEISPLIKMRNLKLLSLVYTPYFQFSQLPSLTQLKELRINFQKDIDPIISQMKHLTKLSLFATNANISAVSSLQQLEELQLGWNIIDLTPIKSLVNLKVLKLHSNIASLKLLSSLPKLSKLYLRQNEAELDPLCSLNGLIELDISPIVHPKNAKTKLNFKILERLVDNINDRGGTVKGIDLKLLKKEELKENDELPF